MPLKLGVPKISATQFHLSHALISGTPCSSVTRIPSPITEHVLITEQFPIFTSFISRIEQFFVFSGCANWRVKNVLLIIRSKRSNASNTRRGRKYWENNVSKIECQNICFLLLTCNLNSKKSLMHANLSIIIKHIRGSNKDVMKMQ
jgi:hypothetical protein